MWTWLLNEWKRTSLWLSISCLSIILAAVIVTIPPYLRLVELLGHRIPQPDIQLDYIKGVIWATMLGLTILIWPVGHQDKRHLLWLWAVKCVVMFVFMLFYEDHYQTDAFGYFAGARFDIITWRANDMGGKSFPVVFMCWLHQHSFFDSFHATKASFGMIGLIGIYVFYRSAVEFIQKEKIGLLYFFALFPSILFWSSILGKEPYILLFIGIYCLGTMKWLKGHSFAGIFIALTGITLVSFFRSWMGAILVLPLFLTSLWLPVKKRTSRIAAILILFFSTYYFVNQTLVHFGIRSGKDLTIQANVKSDNFGRGGSSLRPDKVGAGLSLGREETYSIDRLDSFDNLRMDDSTKRELKEKMGVERVRFRDKKDMLQYLPQGILTVLFRPLPGEVRNMFGFFAGLESLFYIFLFIFALAKIRFHNFSDPIFIWAILLILLWASLYAFVGFNLGTVCRYRMQILPVFLGLLAYLAFYKNDPIKKDPKC